MSLSKPADPPQSPRLFSVFKAGFEAVANHLELVLFPITLDLFLWFGPRLNMSRFFRNLQTEMIRFSGSQMEQSSDALQFSQEIWKLLIERFNLTASLRSYPVGIPSLMAGRLPIETPLGDAVSIGVISPLAGVGVWLLLGVIGILLGTLFYQLVAQSALEGAIQWRKAITDWPRAAWQVLVVCALLLAFALLISVPASCFLSVAALGGAWMNQCGVFLYAGFLLWMLYPYVFSAHSIFVNREKALPSIRRGARLSRLTVFSTSFLFMTAILLTQGLDLLWNVTAENSWLSLIGIVGHAFVTTGILAASFVYYRQADQFIESLTAQALPPAPIA
jgi:hypothetical protein